LQQGLEIQGHKTLPCRAWLLEPQPEVSNVMAPGQSAGDSPSDTMAALCRDAATLRISPRIPPIRFRKSVPDCWIGLELIEGKNRQVRRMTAAIGHPTLRLLRVRIGGLKLGDLAVGKRKMLLEKERDLVASDS